jgi:hypothetical protein
MSPASELAREFVYVTLHTAVDGVIVRRKQANLERSVHTRPFDWWVFPYHSIARRPSSLGEAMNRA